MQLFPIGTDTIIVFASLAGTIGINSSCNHRQHLSWKSSPILKAEQHFTAHLLLKEN